MQNQTEFRSAQDFHTSVPQGELVELVARVIEVGKTSRTMEVKLLAEQLLSGKRQQCTRGRFVLAALDS